MNKKGQITIFVIAGIIIVAMVILLFFVFDKMREKPQATLEDEPIVNLQQCIEESVKEGVETLIDKNGYILGSPLTMQYEYEDIPYLCYTGKDYVRCVNQEPMLVEHINREIYNFIDDRIDSCFENLKTELNKRGDDFTFSNDKEFSVEAMPGQVDVKIKRASKLEKAGEKKNIENFEIVVRTSVYDIAKVIERILEDEAKICNSELDVIRAANTWADIDRFRTGDDNVIYTIKDIRTDEKWRFAVRGCVLSTPS